jgi:23S rRNA (adenine2503-C2)-methyltransferase
MHIENYTLQQLEALLQQDGVKPLHAAAIFKRVHRTSSEPLLPPAERWLAKQTFTEIKQSNETISADGWTRKYLLRLHDGKEIESVLMGYPGRMTACISSQVGCAMGCVFCATGHMGFHRHLTTGEIVAQAQFLAKILDDLHGQSLRNIVMMGMGEPLHNFDAVMNAMDILTDPCGMQITPSRVSISTVGHVNGIRKLAERDADYTLSVSLHGASDEERQALIPVNKRWPIADLLKACEDYSQTKQRKVYIAWTLIDGVNDSDDHALRLGALLKGRAMHINLIPLNPIGEYARATSAENRIERFHALLKDASGLPVTVRQKRGIDVNAGCGQLAGK